MQCFRLDLARSHLVGAPLVAGLLLSAAACSESDDHKPPPHECLKDPDCEEGLVCSFFHCVDPNGGSGGRRPGAGGDRDGGGGSGGGGAGGRPPGGNFPVVGGAPNDDGGAFTLRNDYAVITKIPLRASAIAQAPGRNIYAVLKGDAPEYPNHFIEVDPFLKIVVRELQLESDPYLVADEGAAIALGSEPFIQTIAFPDLAPGPKIPLPLDDAGNPTTVASFAWYPRGFIVSLESNGSFYGLAVYTDRKQATLLRGSSGPTSLTRGLNIEETEFFGIDREGTALYHIVAPVGREIQLAEYPGVFEDSPTSIVYQLDYVFGSTGEVISVKDREAPTRERNLGYTGLVYPNVSQGNVWFIDGPGTAVRSIDIETGAINWANGFKGVNWNSIHHLIRPDSYFFPFISDDDECIYVWELAK